MRVVSLVPSTTETLLAWGVDVVACTRFCEQPDLVHVGGTKDPDVSAIVELRPDLVVLDREENRRPDAEALTEAGVAIHVTHVTSVEDVPSMLRDLAAAVHVDRPEDSGGWPEPRPLRVTAFVPIWKRPWMTINRDTYGASVLHRLGVETVFADEPDRYPTVEPAEVRRREPDLVLLPSEPYPFSERHLPEIAELVPGARPILIDGQDLFWWGHRTAGALERLGAALTLAR